MRRTLTVLALTMAAGAAQAQAVTPPNCHWVAAADRSDLSVLWCRGADGRARPTDQTLLQRPGDYGDGCPGRLMYDGVRCVAEEAAVAAPYSPARGFVAAPPRSRPRVMVLADRKGRITRGLACVDERDVTICKPVPRR